jgi:hypothetical protein
MNLQWKTLAGLNDRIVPLRCGLSLRRASATLRQKLAYLFAMNLDHQSTEVVDGADGMPP